MRNKILTLVIRIATTLAIAMLFSADTNAFLADARYEEATKSKIAQAFSHSGAITSEYSAIDPDSCEIVQLDEETGASTSICPSYNNIPVFISHSDGRYSVSIGEELNNNDSIVGLNLGKLGDKLEWRSRNNELFAVIYRHYILYFDNALEPIGSVLIIRVY